MMAPSLHLDLCRRLPYTQFIGRPKAFASIDLALLHAAANDERTYVRDYDR